MCDGVVGTKKTSPYPYPCGETYKLAEKLLLAVLLDSSQSQISSFDVFLTPGSGAIRTLGAASSARNEPHKEWETKVDHVDKR